MRNSENSQKKGIDELEASGLTEFVSDVGLEDVEKAGKSSSSCSDAATPKTLSQKWTKLVNATHIPIVWLLQHLTSIAARNPKRTIFGITVISLALVALGFSTNFHIELDEAELWTPSNSESMINTFWTSRSGYEGTGRFLSLFFHAGGKEVLGQKQVSRIFDAYDTITGLGGYEAMCNRSWYRDHEGNPTCEVEGPVRFFNSSKKIFEEEVQNDEEAAIMMSYLTYPDEYPVTVDRIFGQYNRSETTLVSDEGKFTGILTSVKSYYLHIRLSYNWRASVIEDKALDAILALDQQWRKEDGDDPLLLVEISTGRSFGDEFLRGIYTDLPLSKSIWVTMRMDCVALVVVTDMLFVCLKHSPVRCTLDGWIYMLCLFQASSCAFSDHARSRCCRRSGPECHCFVWSPFLHWYALHTNDATFTLYPFRHWPRRRIYHIRVILTYRSPSGGR